MTGRDGFRCRLSNVLLALLCVVVPTSGCGSSEEVEEGARDRAKSERIRDSHERIGRRPSRAATNAEPAQLMPGIGRPCEEAKDFDHYFLGNSFEGLPLTGKDRHCSPPPRKVRDENGTLVYMKPGRINTYGYVYGRCAPPQDPKTGHVEGGCAPPLSVSSSPSCERPHSIVRRYSGGHPPPHQHIRVRSAPAALYTEPNGRRRRIEIFTGDAVVDISGETGDLVRRAAVRLVAAPTSRDGARTPGSRLPPPIKGAAEDEARRNPRC